MLFGRHVRTHEHSRNHYVIDFSIIIFSLALGSYALFGLDDPRSNDNSRDKSNGLEAISKEHSEKEHKIAYSDYRR